MNGYAVPSTRVEVVDVIVFVDRMWREVRGIGGHLIDLARVGTHRFRNPHSYTKYLLIRAVQRRTGAETFIEAGAYRGVMADRCARHFRVVYTIEIDETLARAATRYLAWRRNCTVIHGDAVDVLPRLLARPDIDRVLLSLDAHFSGGDTASGVLPEPALLEIASARQFKAKICGIVIDDFRSFGTEPGFPRKWEVLRAVEEAFDPAEFALSVHLDQVILERLR